MSVMTHLVSHSISFICLYRYTTYVTSLLYVCTDMNLLLHFISFIRLYWYITYLTSLLYVCTDIQSISHYFSAMSCSTGFDQVSWFFQSCWGEFPSPEWSVRVAERLALPTSDHGVAGLNPAGGEILPEPKPRFIAQSLSNSPFHRLEMTEILLKGRKTLTRPSIVPRISNTTINM